jgi:hypothetical protein
MPKTQNITAKIDFSIPVYPTYVVSGSIRSAIKSYTVVMNAKLIDSRTKFFIFTSFLNSCQGECSIFSILSSEGGNSGFSLNKNTAGKPNARIAPVCTIRKVLIWPREGSLELTKRGPIMNPRIPPIMKARDCAATHTVLYAGGNQMLLRAMVAI